MKTTGRVVVTAVAMFIAFQAASVAAFVIFGFIPGPPGINLWLATAAAILVGRYTWKQTDTPSEAAGRASGLLASIGCGALLIGGIGFAGGFFGPMIFAPDANQGPMLGIFITGPLGFLIGGVGGFLYWRRRRSAGALQQTKP